MQQKRPDKNKDYEEQNTKVRYINLKQKSNFKKPSNIKTTRKKVREYNREIVTQKPRSGNIYKIKQVLNKTTSKNKIRRAKSENQDSKRYP